MNGRELKKMTDTGTTLYEKILHSTNIIAHNII